VWFVYILLPYSEDVEANTPHVLKTGRGHALYIYYSIPILYQMHVCYFHVGDVITMGGTELEVTINASGDTETDASV
jgi:hypothetical protein